MRRFLPLLLLGLCAAKRQQPVTWWEAASPSTLHPLHAASTLDLRAQAPIYDPLVERDGDTWVSRLADRIDVKDGSVALTLKREARWHDGQRLTPKDVCATVDALRSKEARTPLGSRLGPRLQHCAVHPSDPSVVVIRLARTGEPDPLSALAFPVLPAHLGPLTDPAGPLATSPVGTGPWKARPIEQGVIYTPAPSAQHGTEVPELRLFVAPSDPDEQERSLQQGVVDGWPVLPAAEVATMRTREGWSTTPYPLQTVIGLALDTTEPPLSDPALRRTLDAAVDRYRLCDTLVGSWPEAKPEPCTPTSSPFLLSSKATNHGIPIPEPAAVPEGRSVEISVAIPAELELDPTALGTFLAEAWSPHTVVPVVLPLAELVALDPMERRKRFAVVVDARLGAPDDLRPELALDGGRNWFAVADEAVAEVLDATNPDDQRVLHAVLADERLWLPLVELTAMSGWSARIQPLWMTPVDGLGAIERWGLSGAAAPGPRPPR